MLQDKIKQLSEEIQALPQPTTEEEYESLRLKYISRKGALNGVISDFKSVPKEDKREIGILINELKQVTEQKFQTFRSVLDRASESSRLLDLDLTRSSAQVPVGGRHPLNLVRDEIIRIFGHFGFSIAVGPEVEDDWHVFEALNFPPDHPARDMQDTFFVSHDPQILLRTHTSSVQTRVMGEQKPPIRIICPGRVYRNEAVSARAHCFFHQVEALYIDEHVTFTDLRKVLLHFAHEMFGPETQIRLRPSYFPFTEPSAEMDISCNLCGGKGCSFCKHTGWVEILGCGMVHPNVLEACGIDSSRYTGFALGMGIERITNLKYTVDDLRLFSENDLRFLSQFQSEK